MSESGPRPGNSGDYPGDHSDADGHVVSGNSGDGGPPPYGSVPGGPLPPSGAQPYGPPPGGQPSYANAYGPQPYGPQPYGAAQGGYYAPYPQARPTSGLAIASFICSVGGALIFIIWPLTAIAGIVLGFMAKSEIDKSGGAYGGRGLAVAGIIVGIAVVAITVIVLVLIFVAVSSCHTVGSNGRLFCH
ncbi:MAG: DUF4190 domain-containing protein [Acidimicrobiales bacterium]